MACTEPVELTCESAETMEELLPLLNTNFENIFDCVGESVIPAIDLIPNIKMNSVDLVNDTDFVFAGRIVDSLRQGVGITVPMTKRLDAAFSSGDNAGGLISGVKTNNTVYLVYALFSDDFSQTDFGFLEASLNIENYLPLAGVFTRYRKIKVIRTNGLGEIISYVNNQENFSFSIRSENHLLPALNSVYSAVDHSTIAPIDMIEQIEYGIESTSDDSPVIGSDDGINNAFLVALTSANAATDASHSAWGPGSKGKASIKPFDNDRQFSIGSGTGNLLCQQIKINIEV